MQTGISSTAPSYMSLPLLAMLLENLRQGQVLTSAAHQGRQTTEISPSRGAAARNDRQQGVTTMAASAILLVDDAQGSCTSLFDVIWDLDHQESGAYHGPAAGSCPGRTPPTSLYSITNRPARTALSWTAGSNRSDPARRASGRRDSLPRPPCGRQPQAHIRQLMPVPVDLGRPIPPIEGEAGGP